MTKILKIASLGTVGALLVLLPLALARTPNQPATPGPNFEERLANAKKPIVEINPSGNAFLRGTLVSVNTSTTPNTLMVNSWGGTWIINISSSTKVLPHGNLSLFSAGDFIGVKGTVNTSQSWTVNASIVNDWTKSPKSQQNEQSRRRP